MTLPSKICWQRGKFNWKCFMTKTFKFTVKVRNKISLIISRGNLENHPEYGYVHNNTYSKQLIYF